MFLCKFKYWLPCLSSRRCAVLDVQSSKSLWLLSCWSGNVVTVTISLSLSHPFMPQLLDETILTKNSSGGSSYRAQISSAFNVRLVELGENNRHCALRALIRPRNEAFRGYKCSSHTFTLGEITGTRFTLVWYRQGKGRKGEVWEGIGVVAGVFDVPFFFFLPNEMCHSRNVSVFRYAILAFSASLLHCRQAREVW